MKFPLPTSNSLPGGFFFLKLRNFQAAVLGLGLLLVLGIVFSGQIKVSALGLTSNNLLQSQKLSAENILSDGYVKYVGNSLNKVTESQLFSLGASNPPNENTLTWAPQTGSLSIYLNNDGTYTVRSDFKWTDTSGFSDPHTRYEHEIVFYNWDLFDCKYSDSIASNLVQQYLGTMLYDDVHKPLSECNVASVATNLENAYVDTRLFDKDGDGEAYTIGTTSVPQKNKDYYVTFIVTPSETQTLSSIEVSGSLGHYAGSYATPLQFSPIQELAFCYGAVWLTFDAACTFRSSPNNPILIPRSTYSKNSSFFMSWDLVSPPPTDPAPDPPVLPCEGRSNGAYCGSSLGLTPNVLYQCQYNVATAVQVCTNGCSVQPAGTDDFCSPPPPNNATCPNNENGLYCGSAVGLDPNTLYNCQNGTKTVAQVCVLGCIQKPPGTADVCRSSADSGSCPAGNGDYCGSSLGLDPNTLFTCIDGNSSVKEVCSNGCELMPPGTPDACYPPGSGGGGDTGDKVILYGDSNYGANTIRIQVGIGDSEEPTRGSAYKSMSMPSGWSVILSDQHLGLVGATKCFSASEPNLEAIGWAFNIESMQVFGTNVCPVDTADGVRICRSTGQTDCMTVAENIPSLGQYGFGNDTLKSVSLGGSWELVLFEDDGYGGKRFITGTINDMAGTPFGYGASSLQVRRRDPAAFTLYHLGDFNGGEQFSSDRTVSDMSYWDSFTTPADQKWNDNAQSIRVASGYEIVACVDAGFHGVCGRTNHDNGDLNSVAYGLRNGLSSVQVCLGSCPPTSVPPSLISPANGVKYLPGTPITFSWSGNGEQYRVEYWGGSFGESIQNTGWRDGILAWTVNSLSVSSAPYYWRVQSWTSVGESGWSPTYSFYIQDVSPVQVYINGPVQASLNTDMVYTALTSPSSAVGLTYVWSPAPKSGQGTAVA
ncbi:hypothetical protein KC640_00955, partial [Candidatus Dojkabacteria bacterium]|nr:hypothetical protein [Candidatus Dojkabacteria bacterium]